MTRRKSDRRAPTDPIRSLPPELAGGYWSWLLDHGGLCATCRVRWPVHGPLAAYPHCHRRFGELVDAHLERIGWVGDLNERRLLHYTVRGIGGHSPPPGRWPGDLG